MTNQQGAPVALRLAEEMEHDPGINRPSVVAELRRLHAENTALQQGYDAARLEIDSLHAIVQELGAMLRENCNRRIVELEAQLDAIGAGGVEPLRRRECLHKIVEPAPAAVAGPSDRELLAEWDRVSTIAKAGERRLAVMRAVLAKWGAAPTTQAAPAAQWDAEDAARLDWLESQSQVNIERVRYLGADTSIYEVTPFNSTDYNGETLRKAIDAARKQGEHHD